MLSLLNIMNKCMFVSLLSLKLGDCSWFTLVSQVIHQQQRSVVLPGPLSYTSSTASKGSNRSGSYEPHGELTQGSRKTEIPSSSPLEKQRLPAVLKGVKSIPLAQVSPWQRVLHWKQKNQVFLHRDSEFIKCPKTKPYFDSSLHGSVGCLAKGEKRSTGGRVRQHSLVQACTKLWCLTVGRSDFGTG